MPQPTRPHSITTSQRWQASNRPARPDTTMATAAPSAITSARTDATGEQYRHDGRRRHGDPGQHQGVQAGERGLMHTQMAHAGLAFLLILSRDISVVRYRRFLRGTMPLTPGKVRRCDDETHGGSGTWRWHRHPVRGGLAQAVAYPQRQDPHRTPRVSFRWRSQKRQRSRDR